jgi:uncharacterized tellurite resistance protein B-like protein
LEPVRIPNVLDIQSQFAPLVRIWTSSIEELKPLSRVVAKGADVSTRAAYDVLPDDLKAGTEHPDKPLWEKLCSVHVQEDGTVLLPAGSLAEIHGIDRRPKLTAKQSASLAITAHQVGFIIEPDIRITGRGYGWNDLVALFRPEEKPALPADGRYTGAALMLELGLSIAAADGEIEKEEVGHIASFLESQFLLDPPDVRRLDALMRVFLSQHPSIGGVGKRFKETLAPEQLESVGEFLIGIAASNGSIDKKEITALRSAYRALGLEVKGLDRSLDQFRLRAKEPLEVLRPAESGDEGEAIPPRPQPRPGKTFKLDQALLERLMHETRQVATLLDEAMPEEEPGGEPDGTPETVKPPPAPEPRFDGLEPRHAAVLTELCSRSSWPLGDFDEIVRRHSLMPSGAMDRINEWSHDRFDDPILEEDGERLVIHMEILMEEA